MSPATAQLTRTSGFSTLRKIDDLHGRIDYNNLTRLSYVELR